MTVLLKSGTLVTATETFQADILLEGEKIAQIGQALQSPDAEIVDARGKLILPGGVDPHTHFDLPMFGTVSSDDHYTGHKAAAFGGTTTVIDFVSQEPGSLQQSVDAWHAKADAKAAVDFGFHMNLTHWDAAIASQLPDLLKMGVSSIKVFTAYNGRLRLGDGEIFQAMRLAGEHGLLTLLHAENGDVIDIPTARLTLAPRYGTETRLIKSQTQQRKTSLHAASFPGFQRWHLSLPTSIQ